MYSIINISITKDTISDKTSIDGLNKKVVYNHNNKYNSGEMC